MRRVSRFCAVLSILVSLNAASVTAATVRPSRVRPSNPVVRFIRHLISIVTEYGDDMSVPKP